MPQIFISHSSKNNTEALAMFDWLGESGWDDVFLDIDIKKGIKVGELWREALINNTSQCEAIIFLISKHWLKSNECYAEYILALATKKHIIGVIIDGTTIDKLPSDQTAKWQICNVFADGNNSEFLIKLDHINQSIKIYFSKFGLQTLKVGLTQLGLTNNNTESFTWPLPNKEYEDEYNTPRYPYRGLEAIRSEDAGVYFGRAAELEKFLSKVETIRTNQITKTNIKPKAIIILGASGAGKSSFLLAGIIPRLKRNIINYYTLPIIRPKSDPVWGKSGLLDSLSRIFIDSKLKITKSNIRDDLDNNHLALLGKLRKFRKIISLNLGDGFTHTKTINNNTNKKYSPSFVISIDQAEELFVKDIEKESTEFLSLLNLITLNFPDTLLIFTIRTDSYESLQKALEKEGIDQELFSLTPISNTNYISIVKGPANRTLNTEYPIEISPLLCEELLKQIDGKDALPLLAFTLQRLYVENLTEKILTLEHYKHLGGIKGSIEKVISQSIGLNENDKNFLKKQKKQDELLKSIFIPHLVTINEENGVPSRSIASYSSIPKRAHELLNKLIQSRLLTVDKKSIDNEIIIEVTHEAIFRNWEKLNNWIDKEKDSIIAKQIVQRGATLWNKNNKSSDYAYLEGLRLKEAEELLNQSKFSNTLEMNSIKYLEACRDRETKRIKNKNKNKTIVVIGISLLFILGVLFSVFAIQKERDTNLIISEVLSDYSNDSMQQGFNTRAVRMAVLSSLISPSFTDSNMNLVSSAQILKSDFIYYFDTKPLGVFYIMDDKYIVSWDSKNLIIIDTEKNSLFKHWETSFPISKVILSPDEKYILAYNEKKAYYKIWGLFDIDFTKKKQFQGEISSVKFFPSSNKVLFEYKDQTLLVFDIFSNESIKKIETSDMNMENVKTFFGSMSIKPVLKTTLEGEYLTIYSKNSQQFRIYQFDDNSSEELIISSKSKNYPEIVPKKGVVVTNTEGDLLFHPFKENKPKFINSNNINKTKKFKLSNNKKMILQLNHQNKLFLQEIRGQQKFSFMNIDKIVDFKFSNDDNLLFVRSESEMFLFDTGGRMVDGFTSLNNAIGAIFSPDSKYVLSWDENGLYSLYDINSNINNEYHYNDVERNPIFSKDSRKIIFFKQNNITIYDIENSTPYIYNSNSDYDKLKISNNGKTISIIGANNSIRISRLRDNNLIMNKKIKSEIKDIQPIDTDKFIIEELSTNKTHILNTQKKSISEVNKVGINLVQTFITKDLKHKIYKTPENKIQIWDNLDKEMINEIILKPDVIDSFFNKGRSYILDNNNKYILSNSNFKIEILEIKSKKIIASINNEFAAPIKSAIFSADSRFVIAWASKTNGFSTTDDKDNVFYLLNIEKNKIIKTVNHIGPKKGPVISSKSRYIAYWNNNEIGLIDLNNIEEDNIIKSNNRTWFADFSKDNQYLLYANSTKSDINIGTVDDYLNIYNIQSNNKIVDSFELDDVTSGIEALDDNRLLLWTYEGSVKIWNSKINKITQKKDLKLKKFNHAGPVVSGDKQFLVFISNEKVYLLDTLTTNLIDVFYNDSTITRVLFSHNSRYLLTYSKNKRVMVWDLKMFMKFDIPLLIELICDPTYGLLKGDMAEITVGDVKGIPILNEKKIGENVCTR